MHRRIEGLKWAKACERPLGMPVGRPRGAKRLGVKYEKDFAQACPQAKHGVWFEFLDANGPGHCQVDFLMRAGETLVVLETKYTWTQVGHSQILQLYKPVLEAAYGLRVAGVVVCKNLTPGAPLAEPTLPSAIRRAIVNPRSVTVFQWLAGPLWGDSGRSRASAPAALALAL